MKITHVTEDQTFEQNFRELECGDVFERADVETPKTIYIKTAVHNGHDLKFNRSRFFSPHNKVIVLCAELTVGPPEKK